MNLRAMKIKDYDTKEMKRLIQNIDLKVTIHDTRDHKYSQRDFCMVVWRNEDPETIGRVFKKKITKRFAIRICNWYNLHEDAKELEGWREYLRNAVIKEYEPV